jgi:hypothetical protein
VREESYNGGAKRRLAGGERRSVLISALGKVMKREASVGVFPFIGGVREG